MSDITIGEWIDGNKVRMIEHTDPENDDKHYGYIDALFCEVSDGTNKTFAMVSGEAIKSNRKSLEVLKNEAIINSKLILRDMVKK